MSTHVSTIGFTSTSAEDFFRRLAAAGVRRVIDVRLHNTSQLSGFAKARDIEFFLGEIGGIEYTHEPMLAPTDDMLKRYKKIDHDWDAYSNEFEALLRRRRIERRLNPEMFRDACLLCSEAKPHRCHRRLVCEYLNREWDGELAVTHL